MNQDLRKPTGADGEAPSIDWVARARALAPAIEAAAERTERDRQIPDDLMAALHDAELYRMILPRSMGGGEATALALMEVLEAVAAADASTAWCLGQALGCSLAASFVTKDVAQEIFGKPDAVLAWGPPSPGARAVAADGGYRLTGKWRFASGSRNATWLGCHSAVYEADGAPRIGDDGAPVVRTLIYPRSSAAITDVWQVVGLKGTGSDDYAVSDLFVPESFTFVRDSAADRREPGPLYRIPLLTFYGIAFAGVALGLARATLDDFIALAAEKKAARTTSVLRDNAVVQSMVGQAEGRLGSSRAFLVEMINETWETACTPDPFPLRQRARLRVAITYAMNQAREVADSAYQAAGTNAIFESNPFERRFRDMHTVAQQGQAHLSNFEGAGQAFLGLEPKGTRI